MFQIAWPWMMLVLPVPWLVMRLVPATKASAGGALFAPFASAMQSEDPDTATPIKRRSLTWWGAWLCWLLLVVAASRPQWLDEALELPESGRNLLLAVDVSGSMETADLGSDRRTRLDVVKQVAGEFIRGREGDRVGLILFGSQAYLQTPLTFDRETVSVLLNEAMIGIAGRETALGDAIGMAIKRLRDAAGETVLILLTDGANTAGSVKPKKAAELAAQQGLRIHTIGVGGKPRATRGLFGMQMINPAAELDEATLKQIADSTGGRYYRATDKETLQDIYRQLDELEPVTDGNRTVRPVTDFYPWPLGIGFALSLAMAFGAWRTGVRA